MSHTILKIGDLDLDLQGQIGLQPLQILASNLKTALTLTLDKLAFKLVKYLFSAFKLTYLEFAFTLKLFIDHLNISDVFENW